VLAGPHQPVVVHLLAYAMNSALKNIGVTITARDFPRNPKTLSLLQLADEMARDRIKHLFVFDGDPVFNAPRGLLREQPGMDWAELQRKVPEVVRLGYHEDA